MNGQTPLEELGEAIQKAKAGQEKPEHKASLPLRALNMALEMVIATGVGCFLGYQLDKWIGSLPIFFIIGFFLGVAAGALTLYKQAAKMRAGTIPQENKRD